MRKDYFGIKSSRNNLNGKHLTSVLFFVLLFVFTSQNSFAQAEIDVLGNTISIVGDGTNIPNIDDNTNFGQVLSGTSSAENVYIIQNTGSLPLIISGAFTTNISFSITTLAISPIPAGSSTTIGITFTAPSTLGVSTSRLVISNSDSDEQPYIINLSAISVIDTDGDGVANVQDIDDDNDGIIDSVEGSLDTDSDSVINSLDLDSDNDGIADVVETGENDLNSDGIIDGFIDVDSNGLHDAKDNPELYSQDNAASIFTEVNSVGVWGSSPNATITADPTQFTHGLYSMKILSGSNGTNFASYSFPVVNGTSYTVNLRTKAGQGIRQGIFNWSGFVATPSEFVLEKDWTDKSYTVVANITGTATIRIYSSTSTGLLNDVLFIDKMSIRESLQQVLPDTDSDSIADYLDLDSDNDACFDALEGAGGFTLSEISGNGSLIAVIDSNGIPGGILQGTSPNVTDTNVVSFVCDSDLDGVTYSRDLDDDNDGVIDSAEGFIDTDTDGVINSLDLDSDNDGITDVVETGENDLNGDGIIDGFIDVDGNGLHDAKDNPELYAQDNSASTFTEVNSIGTWVSSPNASISSNTIEFNDGLYSLEILSGANGANFASYSFPVVNGTSYTVHLTTKAGQGNRQGVFNWSGFVTSPNEFVLEKVWTDKTFTVIANLTGTATIRIYSSTSTGLLNDILFIDKMSIRETLQQILVGSDTDSNPDYLDLDSDNDGIPDNIEAQSTLGYIAPTGAVDTNGVDASYTFGLLPIDTDTDLIPDYLDLNSDDEGGDDTIEAGLTLSGTVGNNGLDNNYDSSDDYIDVNGSFDDTQNDNFPDTDGDINFGGDVDFRDSFFAPDKDGDAVPDIGDLDDDNDGIPDLDESGGQNPNGDGDGDNFPFYLDDDDANPAVGDDDGLIQPGFDLDGDLIANHLDLDADGDGIFDLREAGHTEFDVDFNGEIDGVPADFGANGLFNGIESDDTPAATITYTLLDSDTDLIIDALDIDDDGDGIDTVDEDFDGDGNPTNDDKDGDGVPNYLDLDSDNDGVLDSVELAIDSDSDGLPNYLDLDSDSDGISDILEAGGVDSDGDAHVDYPTPGDPSTLDDSNSNGLDDTSEGTPLTVPDNDGIDGLPNYVDIDSDFDGIIDNIEAQTTSGYIAPSGNDADNDGLDDNYDADDDGLIGIGGGVAITSIIPVNTDGTDSPDYLDPDSDNDGEFDIVEGWDFDNDGTPETTFGGADADTDGLYTNYDVDDSVFDATNGGQLPTSFPDTDGDITFGGDVDFRDGLTAPDKDGDGVPDIGDLDDDNDGIPDVAETGGQDPSVDGDGDNVPFYLDDDDANPAVGDDDGLIQPGFDLDADGIANHLDLDADGDGIFDLHEAGHTELDLDFNGEIDGLPAAFGANGLFNGIESDDTPSATITYTLLDSDGDTTVDALDVDDDNDSVNTVFEVDNADLDGDPTTGVVIDTDSDTTLDYLDIDDDGDGVNTIFEVDNADADGDPTTGVVIDTDSDTTLDYLDTDDDGDGVNTIFEIDNADLDGDPTTGVVIDTDSDTTLDYLDTDDDGDGVNTEFEVDNADLDGDPTTGVVIDADSDTTLDYLDTDDDGDGVNTIFEVDNADADGDPTTGVVIDTDSDTTLDYLDTDDDGDGVNTIFEIDNADLDGDPTTGVVIDTDSDTTLDYLDTDDDGDGVNTEFEVDNADLDGDPTTGVVIDTDSDTTLDYLDIDDDGDGVNTIFEVDNADADGDPTTGVVIDTDSDTTLDYLDTDDDGDSINTEFEADNTDADGDPTTGVIIDSDGDTILNYLDADDDGDGIDTINENPDPNADGDPLDAEDKDGDGIPNYLDLDSDNDGILDSVELAIDTDGDGVQNYVDLDSDNDGIFDVVEAGLEAFDSNFDGVIDTLISVGVNGLFDALETFPDSGILNPIYDPIDSTTAAGVPAPDGIYDFLELDSDTDGCNDVTEAGYTDGDSDGLLGTSPVATDANGLVTSAIDGYTIPNDTDVNGTFDFQEYSETTNISTQPVTPPPTIAGGTVNIDITSNANTFQWEVSTTGIGGPYTPIANDAIYSGVTTANLTISNIPLSFDGNFYRVQLSTNNFLCDIPLISDAVEVTVQQDNDGDGIPDITDLDDDNDGIPDVDEDAGGVPVDVDGDGVPNSLDLDSDNDGIYDLVESGQINAANNVVDVNNDGIIDAANAGTVGANGIFDPLENAPDSGVLTNATADSDTDGIVDSNEINADDDGCNDVIEAGFTDPDANGFLGNGTPGAGLVTDANGVVTGQGGYTTPDDNDSNGTYDFQEPGEQVVLSSQPLSQVVVINATANFDVTGTSPVYTWYESTDGGIIWNVMTNGGTNPTVTGANTDTLTLTNVPGSYDGNQYRVVLSSPAYACGGNITSNSALLTVYADFDGDGIGDPVDLDDDNDGIPDTIETGGIDPTSDNDGDGVPVYLDDNDNNISVGNDNGMVEPAFDFDGDGLANHLELDADNDGVYDTNEAGFADLDLDNNGVVDGIPADFGANGLLDSLETVPESGLINYTPLDTDSDTRLNFIDRDDDADGVNTQYENPDADSNGDPSDAQDTDNDGTPDYLDIDDDADGVYTSFEGVNPDGDGNPNTGSTRDTDNDTVFNYLDIDDDGDSVNTVFEGVNPDGDGNPSTGATLNTDGDSLLNYLDTDDDGDSIPTIFENPDANNDGDPADAQDTDGDLIPDYLDNDDDDDTILTFFENPDPDGNGDPLDAQDSDGNGVPDYLDNDDDGDGVLTELENPDPNGNGNPADAQDTDGDGTPDYLDVDDDGDGILTLDEDVDGDGDPTNDDSDADGVPNYLDIDDDNDGIITLTEGPGNVDSDSYPNYLDQDADGDGIPDNVEGQLTLGYVLPAGDSDGNGLDDAYEATPGSGGGIIPVNTDGADNPDYLDSDSDNDNVPDSIEGHNFLAQFDPDVLPSGNDIDNDGLDDAYDGSVGSFLDPNGLIVIDNPATDLPNFDSTDEVNFRDTDDDNDGINTIDEDGDLSGDPIYDDCDEDGNPDYVDVIPCDRIPTGFSPNDDGNNDTLVVPALAQYKDFTMEVYDRWGNIVYEYNNNGREQPLWWDGFSSGTRTINKGEKVPVGTYFYVIEFNQDRIPPRTGWVYVNY